jgi:hypothetical protein
MCHYRNSPLRFRFYYNEYLPKYVEVSKYLLQLGKNLTCCPKVDLASRQFTFTRETFCGSYFWQKKTTELVLKYPRILRVFLTVIYYLNGSHFESVEDIQVI